MEQPERKSPERKDDVSQKPGNPFIKEELRMRPVVPDMGMPGKPKERYAFPTNPRGKFSQAMSKIACNPVDGATGQVDSGINHNDPFREQISQALAIKLNLKTTQHANENALGQVVKSKSLTGGQTLQARAAIYDSLLSPSWFCKSFNLSSKVQTIRQRRLARSMLIGAPVLLAQVDINEVLESLSVGSDNAVTNLNMETRGTAGQLIQRLSLESPQAILRLVHSD